MASIRPIPQQSVHRLVAGQAVFDLTSAVKELVENSIDAGATRVCVKLHDQGLTTIQVSDNGNGVPKSCRHLMAAKHATSKLRTFADLYGYSAALGEDKEATSNGESQSTVSTLGFRGEALFSLANISKSLVVTTKTQDETVGEELTYDCQGNLIERRPIARSVGTTVSVHSLFERLPVRRADLCKKIKSHRSKLIKILQGYAILCLDTQFQWFDVNPSKSKPKSETIKLATSDGGNTATLGTRTASILGTKFHDGLCHISIDLNSVIKDTTSNWSVRGLISYAPASPHPATARGTHFFSINDRPVDLPKVSSLIGDVWKSFDSDGQKRPAAILAFSLPNHAYDVNLSPDKREVMFTEGTDMMGLIREELSKHWMSQSGGKFEANEVETRSNVGKGKSESQQNGQSETVFVNKITPRSIRKQNDDKSNASPGEDPLSSLGTNSNAVISSPAIQNQSENSDKEITNNLAVRPDQDLEQVVDNQDMSNDVEKKVNRDRRAWEQTKLSFNRIDKSQQQKNMANLLSQANNNETVNASGRVSADSSARKRSFLEQFAFKSTVSKDSNSGSMPSCKDTIGDEPSVTEVRETAVETVKRMKRKTIDDSDTSQPDENERDDDSDNDVDCKRDDTQANQVSKSRRMIVGQRIMSSKPLQGRARDKERTKTTRSSRRSHQSKGNIDDTNRPPKSENNIVWNSFSGTQSVIAQSRYSQALMRKRRKILKQSINPESPVLDGSKNEDAKSVVNLCREDFIHMSIVGQFNLSFILARCGNHSLWLLDQHACDEKYNFEKLCKETVIHEQRLMIPMQLEVSPSEENCILEHMDLFEKNGFRFEYNPDEQPRKRLSLTALPHSGSGGDGTKAVQFGKEDVGALCALLGADVTSSDGHIAGFGTGADGSGLGTSNAVRRFASGSSGTVVDRDVIGSSIVRLPKAIAMFASRACRRSIMFGTALSHKEQTDILKKLDKTEVPWNCAHGRPTMSHIRSLEQCLVDDEDAIGEHFSGPAVSTV